MGQYSGEDMEELLMEMEQAAVRKVREALMAERDQIAELRAEEARLRELIDAAGKHWLDLQIEHPIQWHGAIDDAMRAACDEVRKLKRERDEARDFESAAEDELNRAGYSVDAEHSTGDQFAAALLDLGEHNQGAAKLRAFRVEDAKDLDRLERQRNKAQGLLREVYEELQPIMSYSEEGRAFLDRLKAALVEKEAR